MIETKQQAIDAVKRIQEKTGWSQREIAKRAKVNNATISRILSGNTTNILPTLEVRKGINRLLNAVNKM